MSDPQRRLRFREDWELGERIGGGGFGDVFAASSSSCERAVAKLVPKRPGAQRELLFADLRDARNIVPIIDSGETDDSWGLIMPRAEKSLRQHLSEAAGALPVEQCVTILLDIAEALSDLDGRVAHRDLKPENVLLLDGHWCLADFGISRYADATTAPDTRKYAMSSAYAAPEHWRFERASSSADVYSLGVIAYEMLAGTLPFSGIDREDLREQHLHADPPALVNIPDPLRALVEECLYKAPGARPASRTLETRLARVAAPARLTGIQRLHEANRAEVTRRGALERQKSEAQSQSERRLQLVDAATKGLLVIADALREAIVEAAPTAIERSRAKGSWLMQIGQAELRFAGLQESPNDGSQRASPVFDVVAHSSISIHVPSDEYGYEGRSHSLWYCDAQQPGSHQWFETAFMISPLIPRSSPQNPFALSPGQEARSAIGPGIGELQVAWPFTAVSAGELDDFIDRWSTWLAEGAGGQLHHPHSMPERPPTGSWRQH